jgi:hypothetical protein
VKAPVSNLVRYKPSGVYFARAKVGGKLIRQSVKTDVLSVAKLRLADLLATEQKNVERRKTIEVENARLKKSNPKKFAQQADELRIRFAAKANS